MNLRLRHRARSGRGQSLVEFALVFPIAILIILAVFDVGRLIFVYNGLTNAAREGVRLAIVNQNEPLINQRVQEMAIGTAVSNLNDPNLVQFNLEGPNMADPLANPACTPPTTMATGCIAVVTAEARWSAITPIIGAIIGPITVRARSELPVEFVCPNPNILAYNLPTSCPKQP
jgi:Flp pilus assembly protein TadG